MPLWSDEPITLDRRDTLHSAKGKLEASGGGRPVVVLSSNCRIADNVLTYRLLARTSAEFGTPIAVVAGNPNWRKLAREHASHGAPLQRSPLVGAQMLLDGNGKDELDQGAVGERVSDVDLGTDDAHRSHFHRERVQDLFDIQAGIDAGYELQEKGRIRLNAVHQPSALNGHAALFGKRGYKVNLVLAEFPDAADVDPLQPSALGFIQ